MPYYKNTQDFIQPITISGKRYIVKPNQIIHSERELDTNIYTFLEETDDVNATDPTPLIDRRKPKERKVVASAKSVEELKHEFDKSVDEINSLKTELKEKVNEVNSLHEELKNINEKVNVTVTREQMVKMINEVLRETPKIEPEELESMAQEVRELKNNLENISENSKIVELNEKLEKSKSNDELFFKRLEIIKKVVKNLESVVYGYMTNGEGVIPEDDEVIVVEGLDDYEKE